MCPDYHEQATLLQCALPVCPLICSPYSSYSNSSKVALLFHLLVDVCITVLLPTTDCPLVAEL